MDQFITPKFIYYTKEVLPYEKKSGAQQTMAI